MKKKLLKIWLLVVVVMLVCSIAAAREWQKRKGHLSQSIKDAIAANYPNATIGEIDREEPEIKLVEVELALQNGGKIDVLVARDGTIMSEKEDIQVDSLPFDVSKLLSSEAQISEAESVINHAVLAPVKLEQPQQLYELEVIIDGHKVEYKVASDGTVLNRKNEKDDDDKGKDDDDDQGDNDHEDDD